MRMNKSFINIISRVLCLFLMVSMVFAVKNTAFAAAVSLNNPEQNITATFDVDSEVTFSSDYGSSTPVKSYVYRDEACTDLVQQDTWCDAWDNQSITLTLTAGTYYFKFDGSPHTVKVEWAKADYNRTFDTKTPISVAEGTDLHIDMGKNGEFWFLLDVPTAGKYTFKKNSVMGVWLMKGLDSDSGNSMFNSSSGQLTNEQETLILTKGQYTIMARSASAGNVDFTITNNTFAELTAMEGDAKVLMGAMSKYTYTLKLTPAVNDSTIKVTADLSAPFSINTVDKNTYVFESSSYFTGKSKVTFTSDDGFTKTIEVWVGPVAASVKSEGTHNSTTLKMQTNAGYKPQYIVYQLVGSDYKKVGSTSGDSCTIKNLKPNSEYTFKVVACDGDIEGGATIHKAITAPNKKVSGIKVKCTGCKYYKGRKPTWEYSRFSGWYKVSHPARSYASVKVNYKKPKGASYVMVNGSNTKSGKSVSISFYGKVKAGKKTGVTFRAVREAKDSIAYGPTTTKKVTLKGAK